MRARSVRMEANTFKLLSDQLRHALPLEVLRTPSDRKNFVGLLSSLSAASASSIADVTVFTSLSITEPAVGRLSMSTLLELDRMQQHVARLRRRIENQTRYIEVLEDHPDIAKRASDVLARDNEEMRCALIQLEDLQRLAQQETNRTDTPTDSNSNVA